MDRADTVGPVTLGFARIDSSSRSFHLRMALSVASLGPNPTMGQLPPGPFAAIAGRAVVATRGQRRHGQGRHQQQGCRQLVLHALQPLRGARALDGHAPTPLGWGRYSTSCAGKRVTGSEGRRHCRRPILNGAAATRSR